MIHYQKECFQIYFLKVQLLLLLKSVSSFRIHIWLHSWHLCRNSIHQGNDPSHPVCITIATQSPLSIADYTYEEAVLTNNWSDFQGLLKHLFVEILWLSSSTRHTTVSITETQSVNHISLHLDVEYSYCAGNCAAWLSYSVIVSSWLPDLLSHIQVEKQVSSSSMKVKILVLNWFMYVSLSNNQIVLLVWLN